MTRTYLLDERGRPTPCEDYLAWGRWFETADRGVALDVVGGAYVTTTFMGLDQSLGGGRPLLYETMTFGGAHVRLRYACREDALNGHRGVVEGLRAASPLDDGRGA
jgi:hypothetical protein